MARVRQIIPAEFSGRAGDCCGIITDTFPWEPHSFEEALLLSGCFSKYLKNPMKVI
jgi:hypothetical protein